MSATTSEIAAAIPADARAVSCRRVMHHPHGRHVAALVVTPRVGAAYQVATGPEARVRRAVTRWRRSMEG